MVRVLSVVIIAILVLGPKDSIVIKKIGIYVGKFKNTITNFQRVTS